MEKRREQNEAGKEVRTKKYRREGERKGGNEKMEGKG